MSNQYVCRLSLRQLTKMQIQWKFQLINCSFLFGSFQQTILSKYRANFVFHWFFFLWMLIKLDEVFLRYQQRIAFIRGIRPNQQIEPFYRHQKPSEFSAGNTETQLCIHSRAHTSIFKLTSIDIRKTFISFEMASRGLHHRAEWTQKVNNSKKQTSNYRCWTFGKLSQFVVHRVWARLWKCSELRVERIERSILNRTQIEQ